MNTFREKLIFKVPLKEITAKKYRKNAVFAFLFIFFFTHSTAFSQYFVNKNDITLQDGSAATSVCDYGIILHTVNAGTNWTPQASGTSNNLTGIVILNDGTSLAVGFNGTILKSTDNGNSWHIVNSNINVNLNNIIAPPGGSNILVCGNNNIILMSVDHGDTWVQVPDGASNNNNLKHLYFIDHLNGFVIGSNSTLYKTTDGGYNWTNIDMSFGNYQFNAIAAADINHLTVIGDNGTILSSVDGGYSWFRPPVPVYTQNFNDIIFLNETDGIIVTANGVILKCNDGGSLWNETQVLSTVTFTAERNLKAVAFTSSNFGIAVGESGVNFYTTNGGDLWIDVPPAYNTTGNSEHSKSYVSLNQNFPNPFNPSTVISYYLPFDAMVSLIVYDMLGKEIKTLVNGTRSAGNYNIRFDGSELSSGIYFCMLKTNNGKNEFSKTMRMILTK